jgi:predicted TIM-barrel fold metal-dependent hydrolase
MKAIIDCHIHPPAGEGGASSWFHAQGDARAFFETLRRAGIERACGALLDTLSLAPRRPSSFAEIRALNDAALALRDRYPDIYIPGIHIHPHFPEESCAEIARCCGGVGVRWIGELVGYLLGYDEEFATPPALAMVREAARHRAVVNLHCGSLPTVEALCRAVPALQVVHAHPGGGREEIRARAALLARMPNLHLDISGSGIDRLGILRHLVETAGAHKLLFGTDFPINNPAVYVHGALFERLDAGDEAALFHGNFLRLTTGRAAPGE